MMFDEKVWFWIANKLPAKLIYWASIRMGAFATTGKYSNTVVPDMTFVDALKRWSEKCQA